VEAHGWDKTGRKLKLIPRPPMGMFWPLMSMSVPGHQKEAVETLLARHAADV
jgi:hypothetical protein